MVKIELFTSRVDDVTLFLFDPNDVTEAGPDWVGVGKVVSSAAVLCLHVVMNAGFLGIVVGVVFLVVGLHGVLGTIWYRKLMKGVWLFFGWSRRMSDQEEVSWLAFSIGPSMVSFSVKYSKASPRIVIFSWMKRGEVC